jgi:alkanesulfonate monooxygenase SsuD/methylene tetrahydromethanopterin reductase-like flavin-dependent oxidoreductase (luciferase family)
MAEYRGIFLEVNGRPAPQPIVAGWVFCDEDEGRAREQADKWIGGYYRTVLDHYRFADDHLKTTKGYEWYGAFADKIQEKGEQEYVDFFRDLQIWGTPDQCYRRIMDIQKKVNSCGFVGVFSYAGMPWGEAERSLRLFTEKVVPRLKAFDAGAEPDMTEAIATRAAE